MIIKVTDEIFLSEINKKDKPLLIKYLNDKDIYKNTLTIPNPYTSRDAEKWIKNVFDRKKEIGRLTNFTIRDKDMNLIGGIGYHVKYGNNSHKDEFGYWLAKDCWNKGIMTKVIGKFCEMGFNENNLIRIEATVFIYNPASVRVLEKNGFKREGLLKKYVVKDGIFLDVFLYALIKDK